MHRRPKPPGRRRLRDTAAPSKRGDAHSRLNRTREGAGNGPLSINETYLLLDDDREVAFVLGSLLEEEGYYVSVSRRVGDARELLERVKIDLFIADLLLPDPTGG